MVCGKICGNLCVAVCVNARVKFRGHVCVKCLCWVCVLNSVAVLCVKGCGGCLCQWSVSMFV